MDVADATWTLERVESLISNRVQEDLHLDYKAAKALGKSPGDKKEIAKDISAFANSDGGVIIYGVSEDPTDRSFPKELNPVDSTEFSAEWIEQVALSQIQPKISGIRVTSIPVAHHQVVFVVEIPKGETAHQAPDKLYHKRRGRTTEAMWDYEVRDVMNRKTTPKVSIELSIVRRVREIKNPFGMPHFMEDPLRPRMAPPEKEYKTNEWLRVRAVNEGSLVIHYLNVFVEVDPPAAAATGVRGESEPVEELYCDNTIRDVVDVKMIGIGGVDAVPKYGPSRYDPILPGLSMRLQDHEILPGSYTPDTKLRWKAHADTASVVEGELRFSELEIIED